MSTPYQTCGPDCPYWQPTGVSRCEGICAVTGELAQDGNACNVHDHGDEYQPIGDITPRPWCVPELPKLPKE
jgi:hypothetical protein